MKLVSVAALAACLLLAACQSPEGSRGPASVSGITTEDYVAEVGSTDEAPTSPAPTPTRVPSRYEENMNLTVYYTAVESFHSGATTTVSGCLNLGCSSRGTIGTYPTTFVDAAAQEGTGRITSGTNAGKYLNWSYDIGYWLDVAPRDARGQALIPYVSAAADADVFAFGESFTLVECGDDGWGKIDAGACAAMRAGNWVIKDRFTPGLGGARHLDLYIGEQDRVNFESSPKYLSAYRAVIGVY